MDQTYRSVIEAIIFSSDEPIAAVDISKAIKGIDGEEVKISDADIENAVIELNAFYTEQGMAFQIKPVAGGFTHYTKPEFAKYLGYLSSEKSKRRLSQAALETLAIIAYKQPITKPEIELIRGVNIDHILNSLIEKTLITIEGRAETVGRPLLYITTNEFLKYFGLNKISDLPKPREIEEIMQDEEFIEQKRKLMMSQVEEALEKDAKESESNENQ